MTSMTEKGYLIYTFDSRGWTCESCFKYSWSGKSVWRIRTRENLMYHVTQLRLKCGDIKCDYCTQKTLISIILL